MILGIKEGLVECATVCVKSVVILKMLSTDRRTGFASKYFFDYHKGVISLVYVYIICSNKKVDENS